MARALGKAIIKCEVCLRTIDSRSVYKPEDIKPAAAIIEHVRGELLKTHEELSQLNQNDIRAHIQNCKGRVVGEFIPKG